MEGFVTATPRERREDEDAPPPPKASIGKLPKGERPASGAQGRGVQVRCRVCWLGQEREECRHGAISLFGPHHARGRKGDQVGRKDAQGSEGPGAWLEDVRGREGRCRRVRDHGREDATEAHGHARRCRQQAPGESDYACWWAHGKAQRAGAGQVWLAEESKLGGSQIIEDRLIFAATNLAPLLRLRGRLIFEITAVHELVKQWRVMFEKEKESAKVDVAAKAVKARKAARTEQYTKPGAPPAEERCRAIKAWPGQPEVADTFSLEADEIVFRLEDFGDGWSKVRRQIDGTNGLVPTKRLRLAPLPPAEEEPDEEPPADGGRPPPPELSDYEEMAEEEAAARQAEADDAQVEACTEARMAEVAAAEELARMEADAAECGYGGD